MSEEVQPPSVSLASSHPGASTASTSSPPNPPHPVSPSTMTTTSTTSPPYISLPAPFPAAPQTSFLPRFSVVIEFCDRCRWIHRAVWTLSELLATFGEEKGVLSKEMGKGDATPTAATATGGTEAGTEATNNDHKPPERGSIKSITLLPLTSEDTAGRFRVWIYSGSSSPFPSSTSSTSTSTSDEESNCVCIWDRKIRGRFPEMKELKQAVRDVISPTQSLGHSDCNGIKGTGKGNGNANSNANSNAK